MDELRESSLLFSLEGLLETERERVDREAREAERRREEELARVAEMAERRRLAVQQEREARERRQTLERERERLEHERGEALKRAAVERARLEAEGQLRLLEAEHQRQHELKLLALREDARASRYRALTWLSGAGCVVGIIGSFVAHFAVIAPAHARAEQELRAMVRSTQDRALASERALEAERRKNQELARAASRSVTTASPADAVDRAPAAQPSPRPGQREVKTTSAPCVDNADPLNPCLRGGKRH
jgi:colicin import membrane protein